MPADLLLLLLQIVVGDKRVMKFGSCGMTEGFGLVREARRSRRAPRGVRQSRRRRRPAQAALQGVKPHIPPATANRADNSGNWTAGDRD